MKARALFLAAAVAALPTVASATTFAISFTQTGLGDAGPDWFGTFEAPADGGWVTSFSATIDGTMYQSMFRLYFYGPNDSLIPNTLIGRVGTVPYDGNESNWPNVFLTEASNGTVPPVWGLSVCDLERCNDSDFLGPYSIAESTSPIPEPSTYALMLAGLGLLGFIARRRRQ
jgi:PEP-CTERM motif